MLWLIQNIFLPIVESRQNADDFMSLIYTSIYHASLFDSVVVLGPLLLVAAVTFVVTTTIFYVLFRPFLANIRDLRKDLAKLENIGSNAHQTNVIMDRLTALERRATALERREMVLEQRETALEKKQVALQERQNTAEDRAFEQLSRCQTILDRERKEVLLEIKEQESEVRRKVEELGAEILQEVEELQMNRIPEELLNEISHLRKRSNEQGHHIRTLERTIADQREMNDQLKLQASRRNPIASFSISATVAVATTPQPFQPVAAPAGNSLRIPSPESLQTTVEPEAVVTPTVAPATSQSVVQPDETINQPPVPESSWPGEHNAEDVNMSEASEHNLAADNGTTADTLPPTANGFDPSVELRDNSGNGDAPIPTPVKEDQPLPAASQDVPLSTCTNSAVGRTSKRVVEQTSPFIFTNTLDSIPSEPVAPPRQTTFHPLASVQVLQVPPSPFGAPATSVILPRYPPAPVIPPSPAPAYANSPNYGHQGPSNPAYTISRGHGFQTPSFSQSHHAPPPGATATHSTPWNATTSGPRLLPRATGPSTSPVHPTGPNPPATQTIPSMPTWSFTSPTHPTISNPSVAQTAAPLVTGSSTAAILTVPTNLPTAQTSQLTATSSTAHATAQTVHSTTALPSASATPPPTTATAVSPQPSNPPPPTTPTTSSVQTQQVRSTPTSSTFTFATASRAELDQRLATDPYLRRQYEKQRAWNKREELRKQQQREKEAKEAKAKRISCISTIIDNIQKRIVEIETIWGETSDPNKQEELDLELEKLKTRLEKEQARLRDTRNMPAHATTTGNKHRADGGAAESSMKNSKAKRSHAGISDDLATNNQTMSDRSANDQFPADDDAEMS